MAFIVVNKVLSAVFYMLQINSYKLSWKYYSSYPPNIYCKGILVMYENKSANL